MTPELLDQFREQLLDRRRILLGDVESLATQALDQEASRLTEHMADQGTDTYDQEFALGVLQVEEGEIREIDEAMARIHNGSFGICENCQEGIPLPRLEVIPFARLCANCKRLEEEESGL